MNNKKYMIIKSKINDEYDYYILEIKLSRNHYIIYSSYYTVKNNKLSSRQIYSDHMLRSYFDIYFESDYLCDCIEEIKILSDVIKYNL